MALSSNRRDQLGHRMPAGVLGGERERGADVPGASGVAVPVAADE
eukprot:CAMPEP_0113708248 /NCGR_PEP_ID=MMETSP0038_2-20120614/28863_1 /TAXON_ID=2898 /ORGANISM="Cryptomonas paramecium" /LENGTH=44 /DNA_ID=CAMNT_0000633907 /DNA_START=696 /DNA_END=828 /DNA_ORIENTATION=- /assembly_acc=CAM_ASM_000170